MIDQAARPTDQIEARVALSVERVDLEPPILGIVLNVPSRHIQALLLTRDLSAPARHRAVLAGVSAALRSYGQPAAELLT